LHFSVSKGVKLLDSVQEDAFQEKELVQRIVDGRRDEFQVLVHRYQGRIYSVAYRLLGNAEEAEDCAQEAFLKAYRNLGRFHGRSGFYTWLYRITVNLALSRLKYLNRRGRGRTDSVDGEKDNPDTPGPVELKNGAPSPRQALEQKDLEARLLEAIQSLADKYRVPIVLRDMEERPYEEIAEIMKLPLGTVKRRIHEGRAQLQKKLVKYLVEQQ
jgi:RNA polymerase sigma-70 factor, ECF subfamily